ncbi:hypothetical protein A2533_00475 [Candidatus Falkowbacteria bacterium RIFOXYD2_FULL_35_9]|uniref:Uncharacterized protein n=2 Tax=Candidatus Falkowiibacteriota TaxID=1752728 RepID=A0A1F5T022_9BACT|nr:MAG: hypothetical protein A2242_00955 [Candidatus Falkowbacteria bacterium RIFOXYA2_FULL_47_9]OGF30841.1 MAG: hypothetical protein A2300_03155 [Candidatus Falkowbacteria bacterium RIFOXYB2_FULL_35_7]OGF32304.1 MAG: hypothetical protein A2478_03190 [Candidatus Falkowbacteria bacterium RIFOXYC2_FULL_36_12]OGF46645.1 MAG: hypothetical protein A2533_00475 [Candidatus Falkowbacteria bacterium RIFOXYD2_FULL_35_9]
MKVVIAGSAKLQNEIQKWIEYWNSKNDYLVLDYPKAIPEDNFDELYPEVHKNFFKNITEADVLFIANYKKNGIGGYIGAETFAELGFGLAQKLIYGKKIRLILANMPVKEVACYDEIFLWKKLGWIDEIIG